MLSAFLEHGAALDGSQVLWFRRYTTTSFYICWIINRHNIFLSPYFAEPPNGIYVHYICLSSAQANVLLFFRVIYYADIADTNAALQKAKKNASLHSNHLSLVKRDLSLSGVGLVQLLELEYSRTHLQLNNPCCMLAFYGHSHGAQILNNYEVVVYREFFLPNACEQPCPLIVFSLVIMQDHLHPSSGFGNIFIIRPHPVCRQTCQNDANTKREILAFFFSFERRSPALSEDFTHRSGDNFF